MRSGRGCRPSGRSLAPGRIVEQLIKIAPFEQLRRPGRLGRGALVWLFGWLGRRIRHHDLAGTGGTSHHGSGLSAGNSHQLVTISTAESDWHDFLKNAERKRHTPIRSIVTASDAGFNYYLTTIAGPGE
jgi:hypothetical protein